MLFPRTKENIYTREKNYTIFLFGHEKSMISLQSSQKNLVENWCQDIFSITFGNRYLEMQTIKIKMIKIISDLTRFLMSFLNLSL